MSRSRLLGTTREAARLGLLYGSTGNLSVRVERGMLITPTAVPYHQLTEEHLVPLTFDGEIGAGPQRPSSEWRLHAEIYRARPEIAAVLHAHSRFATTIACLREDLPAVHYMIAVTGGARVRCCSYLPFGSRELALAAVAALADSRACLLANHGLVTIGHDPDAALRVAVEVETVAEYWWRARAVGTPVILNAAEMADALERIADYRPA